MAGVCGVAIRQSGGKKNCEKTDPVEVLRLNSGIECRSNHRLGGNGKYRYPLFLQIQAVIWRQLVKGTVAWDGFFASSNPSGKLRHLAHSPSTPNTCLAYSQSTPNEVHFKGFQKTVLFSFFETVLFNRDCTINVYIYIMKTTIFFLSVVHSCGPFHVQSINQLSQLSSHCRCLVLTTCSNSITVSPIPPFLHT